MQEHATKQVMDGLQQEKLRAETAHTQAMAERERAAAKRELFATKWYASANVVGFGVGLAAALGLYWSVLEPAQSKQNSSIKAEAAAASREAAAASAKAEAQALLNKIAEKEYEQKDKAAALKLKQFHEQNRELKLRLEVLASEYTKREEESRRDLAEIRRLATEVSKGQKKTKTLQKMAQKKSQEAEQYRKLAKDFKERADRVHSSLRCKPGTTELEFGSKENGALCGKPPEDAYLGVTGDIRWTAKVKGKTASCLCRPAVKSR